MSLPREALGRLETQILKRTRTDSVSLRILKRLAAIYLRRESYGNWHDLELSGELGFVRNLARRMPPGVVAIECGACDGAYSKMLLKNTSWNVIAIEPNQSVLPSIKALKKSFPGRLRVIECAVGAEDGVGTMFQMPNAQHSTMIRDSLQIDYLAGQDYEAVPVQVRTLDGIFSEHCRDTGGVMPVGLLKLDVEGSEADALNGCSQLLAANRPHSIQVESNQHNLYQGTNVY